LTSLNNSKNGSLEFTDFKSSGGIEKGKDSFKRSTSPRSPVGRRDKYEAKDQVKA